MGVRGLTSLLSRHGRPEPVDLAAGHAGRTVVLDVPSFAIWLFLAFFRQASMLANTDYARVGPGLVRFGSAAPHWGILAFWSGGLVN